MLCQVHHLPVRSVDLRLVAREWAQSIGCANVLCWERATDLQGSSESWASESWLALVRVSMRLWLAGTDATRKWMVQPDTQMWTTRKGVVAETSKYMGFLAPIPEFLQPCGTAAFGIAISAFSNPCSKLSGTTSGPKSSPWLRGQNLYGAQNWQA